MTEQPPPGRKGKRHKRQADEASGGTGRRSRPGPVQGRHLPPPRLTAWAFAYGVLYVALPFLAAMAAIDTALYLLFRFVFGTCYGVLCLV